MATLMASVPAETSAAPDARSAFTIVDDVETLTVAHHEEPQWRAVLHRKHGGAISAFHLPADGPNLVANENSSNPFRGLMNLFYMTRVPKPDGAAGEHVEAKGTIWGSALSSSIRVVAHESNRLVVEISGASRGWRFQNSTSEPVATYRQLYTFRPDRIVCAGELNWQYSGGTPLEEMALISYIAPERVHYPVLIEREGNAPREAPVTSSHGSRLPDGVNYPLTLNMELKNGYSLRFRPLKLPPAMLSSRIYILERPFQQEWAQLIGFIGHVDKAGGEKFPASGPVAYEYEMEFGPRPAAAERPQIAIKSPVREGKRRLGETIAFEATATGFDGRPLSAESITWEIYRGSVRLLKKQTGASIACTIPSSAAEYGTNPWITATASVTDSAGRRAVEYTGVQVDLAAPPVEPGPPFEWRPATPESHGVSTAKLNAWKDDLAARRTKALFVAHDDKVVCEWYSADHSATKPHGTASMAKAIVGGLALGVALSDGRISLDDKAAKLIPQWSSDPMKSRITIRHLGSHTSGLQDAWNKQESAAGVDQGTFSGWEGEFWRWRSREPGLPNDAFTLSRDRAPLIFEPGTDWAYSNPGIAMMDYAVTASLKGVPHEDIRTLLRDRILRPIGISDDEWSCGYKRTEIVDGLPLVASWGGGAYSARATARIGRLMLREGNWEGRQILSAEAVRQITTDVGTPGPNGMGWWSNNDGHVAALPRDAFWGAGAGGQVVLVVPSWKLVAVRNGGALDAGDNDAALKKHFFTPLAQVFASAMHGRGNTGKTPVPPQAHGRDARATTEAQALIRDISWAPTETIIRRAKGSDNWPMTWGDDDLLYAAYGDGNGFEPFVPQKLSLGLAKITGSPPDFQGVNLRAPSVESQGNDVHGHKASGMLMVDGILYLLARNLNNAQLAWSRDRGATWTWADWKFAESFGAPTFINFGRNYAGARDSYVYVVSHDSDTAYQAADGFVLARVPAERIHERAAWEFFAGRNNSQPDWSRDVAQRAPILSAPGKCYRVAVTYNAALERYLLVHPVASERSRDGKGFVDTRFVGGLAIYEARNPWGPWSQVFHKDAWDVGPGETASFPPKWMSADGRTLHLVFSGDDYFSVRRATLVTEEKR